MAGKRCVCFLISNEPRDFYITFPVLHYIEHQMGYSVSFRFAWDAHTLYTDPPDMVLLPNARGHNMYFELSRYCFQSGIPHFVLDSEGNFIPDPLYDYWGYNTDKRFYYPIHLPWSERIRQFLLTYYPVTPEQVRVCGATGFDKYRYLHFPGREEVLTRLGKPGFKHVIGYAGWAFGKRYTDQLPYVLGIIQKDVEWFEAQRDQISSILRTAIEANPDILFILKKHPRENFESDTRDTPNEMNPLRNYANVVYLRNEEEIQDLIGISDLWLSFESTSAMEAWMMEVPTAFINPDPHFQRSPIWKGCHILPDYSALAGIIDEVVRKGNASAVASEDVLSRRAEVIRESIGFADGLNHLRAGRAIADSIHKMAEPVIRPRISPYFLRLYLLLHVGKWFFNRWLFSRLPKFKKTVWVFEERKLHVVNQKYGELSQLLQEFYARNGISPDTHEV